MLAHAGPVTPARRGYRCVDLIGGGRLELRVTGGASAGWVVTSVAKVVD